MAAGEPASSCTQTVASVKAEQRLLAAGLPCSNGSHAMSGSTSTVHMRAEAPGDRESSPLPAGKTRAASFHDIGVSDGSNDSINSGDGAKENCQEFALKCRTPVKLPALQLPFVKPWDTSATAARDGTRSPVSPAGDTICPHTARMLGVMYQ